MIRQAYNAWRSAAPETPVTDWLKSHAGEFERLGYHRRLEAGERRITSEWRLDIWSLDADGGWKNTSSDRSMDDEDDTFVAVRAFDHQDGAWGITHVEHCGHPHSSRKDAIPCHSVLAAVGSPPTAEDLDSPTLPFIADGWHMGLGMNDSYEGLVAMTRREVLVPFSDGVLCLPWDEVPFRSFKIAIDGVGAAMLGQHKGRRALVLDPAPHLATMFLMILVYPFGMHGEDAWVERLKEQGLRPREGQAAPPSAL